MTTPLQNHLEHDPTMMLVRFRLNDETHVRVGMDDGDALYDLSTRFATVRAFLETYPAMQDEGAFRACPRVDRADVTLLTPIDEGANVYLVGANYKKHALEAGLDVPLTPVIFMKPTTALVGNSESIVLPPISNRMDYEGEMAVVIGRTAWRVSAHDAHHYIGGLTVVNDVTARDLQWVMLGKNRIVDWLSSKCLDQSTPAGPGITPVAAVKDIHKLQLRTWLNDALMQDGNTDSMVFSTYQLIEYLSARVTLRPGDVISTGTPVGVGGFRDIFLKPGDVLRVEVEGVGTIINPVGLA